MKYCFHVLYCAAFAFAQQSGSTVYTTDLNGHVVTETQYIARDGDHAQLDQSINGRQVPLQSTETHVLTDQPNHSVVETIVRKYDGTGQFASTERTVTDEQKGPAGSTVRATIFRSDVNGEMQERERRVIKTQVNGKTTTAEVSISRPGLTGSFDTAEKREIVTTAAGDTLHETESIQRPSINGATFTEVARQVREVTKSPGKVTTSATLYEHDYQGNMAVSREDVATTTKTGTGTEVTELATYAPSTFGLAREGQAAPKLRQQETIVRSENNGIVTEATTVQRPTLSDPNRLGEATPVSTVICKGTCEGALQTPGYRPYN